MDNEKLSHAQVKNILRDLDSQIQGLQYRNEKIKHTSRCFCIEAAIKLHL